jgi:hypothetical protein
MKMGSGNYTIAEAANRLRRSKRQVHNYMNDGFLTRIVENGAVFLLREDVELLAVDLGTDMPALNRKTFFQLSAKVKRLEEEMTAVKHILEIRDAPLRPSPEEARGLHAAACESLSRRNWEVYEIQLWAQQFEKLDEVALDLVSNVVQQQKPWLPFYELCLELMKSVSPKAGLESAALHRRLDEGRKKMRSTILMWIEMGRGTVPDNVFRLVDSGKESVLRKVTQKP